MAAARLHPVARRLVRLPLSGRGLARAHCQVGPLVSAHNLVTRLPEEARAKARQATAASALENTTKKRGTRLNAQETK